MRKNARRGWWGLSDGAAPVDTVVVYTYDGKAPMLSNVAWTYIVEQGTYIPVKTPPGSDFSKPFTLAVPVTVAAEAQVYYQKRVAAALADAKVIAEREAQTKWIQGPGQYVPWAQVGTPWASGITAQQRIGRVLLPYGSPFGPASFSAKCLVLNVAWLGMAGYVIHRVFAKKNV